MFVDNLNVKVAKVQILGIVGQGGIPCVNDNEERLAYVCRSVGEKETCKLQHPF